MDFSSFTHVTNRKIEEIREFDQARESCKPIGLWFSPNSEWSVFNDNAEYEYCYSLREIPKNILIVENNYNSMYEFTKKYKRHDLTYTIYDWTEIYEKYDGVFLPNPKDWSEHVNNPDRVLWISLDVDSLILWRNIKLKEN